MIEEMPWVGQCSQAATRPLPRSRVLVQLKYGCATHCALHIPALCTLSAGQSCPHNIRGARNELCMVVSGMHNAAHQLGLALQACPQAAYLWSKILDSASQGTCL